MSHRRLQRALRHAAKENRLGAGASCDSCKEADLRCLQRSLGQTLCAECRPLQEGKPRYELHHPAGRHNDSFVIPMHANEHAVMSDYQEDWPDETLRNPDGDLLHRHAAILRADHDFLMRRAELSQNDAIEFEALAQFLKKEFRSDWATAFAEWRERKESQ